MADVKITDKIPNNAVKVNYTTLSDVVNVQLLDKDDHVLAIQPIKKQSNSVVTDVTFNKNFNVITIKFEDGIETNVQFTKHLLLTNGDLELVSGTECVMQQIDVGLHLLKGDWVLDSTAGIDYFGGMRAYPEILNAQIKKAINTVENVDTVLKYKFVEDNDQVYNVTGSVKVGNSEIPINNLVKPIG